MMIDDALRLKLRHAIGDPGAFLPRGDHHNEHLTSWQVRAVEFVLTEAGVLAPDVDPLPPPGPPEKWVEEGRLAACVMHHPVVIPECLYCYSASVSLRIADPDGAEMVPVSSATVAALEAGRKEREKVLPVCPECQAGKHGNCDGTSWDPLLDVEGQCPCWVWDHGTRGD